ncbi:hypothetical protein Hdeb2414_s0027g00685711 [Helianthus debilis subsp. tardiflorus]
MGCEVQDKYSEPMVWIGIYIAIASLLFIFAMDVDLLHGFRNKRFWVPCKFFSLNVDLSSDYMDQAAKLGSLCSCAR